eukprot:scaffold7249_cov70-Cyclotella_meneghiniana.AAC.4
MSRYRYSCVGSGQDVRDPKRGSLFSRAPHTAPLNTLNSQLSTLNAHAQQHLLQSLGTISIGSSSI